MEELEKVVELYLDNDKFMKALKASEFAVEQFPFSVELLILNAHVLASNTKYDSALQVLDRDRKYSA